MLFEPSQNPSLDCLRKQPSIAEQRSLRVSVLLPSDLIKKHSGRVMALIMTRNQSDGFVKIAECGKGKNVGWIADKQHLLAT